MNGPTYDFAGQVALVTGAGLDGARHGPRVRPRGCERRARGRRRGRAARCDRRVRPRQVTRRSPSPATSPTKPRSPPLSSAPLRHSAASTWPSTTPASRRCRSDTADEPTETFERVNAINLRGVWACMKHELRQMREQGSGAIVNCSSLGGLVGLPGRAAYHASKHGVLGPDQERRAEYVARRPHQRGLPRHDRHADGRCDGGQRRARHGRGARNQPIGRPTADEIKPPRSSGSAAQERAVVGVALPVDGGYTAA